MKHEITVVERTSHRIIFEGTIIVMIRNGGWCSDPTPTPQEGRFRIDLRQVRYFDTWCQVMATVDGSISGWTVIFNHGTDAWNALFPPKDAEDAEAPAVAA